MRSIVASSWNIHLTLNDLKLEISKEVEPGGDL